MWLRYRALRREHRLLLMLGLDDLRLMMFLDMF